MIGARDVALAAWQALRYRRATRDQIIALRDARLRRLVRHAHARVPYYRALFERHGIEPDRVRTLADFMRIPVSTRRDFQTAPVAALVAQGMDPTGHTWMDLQSSIAADILAASVVVATCNTTR